MHSPTLIRFWRIVLLVVMCSSALMACQQEANKMKASSTASEAEQAGADDARGLPALITYGELRRINLEGDFSPSVGLAEALSGSSPLNHAVGALGELSGEITVWDDDVYLAEAGDEPAFSVSAPEAVGSEREATLLFGAKVDAWKPVHLEGAKDLAALERALDTWRRARGVDEALAFRIVDSAATVEWHVIDGARLPEGVSSCDQRKDYAHQLESREKPVRIVGLYTTTHTGVVVDHTTSIHAHVITDDDRTGHIDALSLSNAARLEVGVHSVSTTGLNRRAAPP
jgi:hypothetical protein